MATTPAKRTVSKRTKAEQPAAQAASVAPEPRGSRKTRMGVVVSDKMKKTIVVRIERLTRHRVFTRVITRTVRFKVHDEANQAKIGDWVRIMETRPLSKDKRWRLVEIIRRGASAPAVPGSEPESGKSASA